MIDMKNKILDSILSETHVLNMGATKLVIYHGGTWVGNCYDGCMTKWVHIPRGLSYDALVKLVQDVAKVDAATYNLELCSLTYTNSGTTRPRIENDNDVSYIMDEDKLLPEVFVTVSAKVATDLCGSIPILYPIVCNDEIIDDQENSQSSDTDNRDDSSIPDVDRGSHEDEDCNHGMGSGSVFPLAYGFGNIKDERSWTWFLNELKNAIGSPEDCMILSDCHLGIKAAMEKMYPKVPHGYCVFHMAKNIKNDYKRKDVSHLFKQAWKAYQKSDFKEVMLEMMKVNRITFEDLMNVRPEKWSHAYSPIRCYRLMTSSIADSMNSCLVHARQMPITTMVKFIRDML
ncbi:hypothetical protein Dsin_001143 [Dipteronia sinensis]|uniref:MULE transposase domain-containing protein n=1 Tax=Dipteronia sinensis TaxID=43782 RepID=A0AAE0B3Q9_9ROSI|nr:hypothetical protein Dsin_001143 [Dipteronia sinensis]